MNKRNYQKELDKLIERNQKEGKTPRLFLHACCAPCSSYVMEYLSQYFEITIFFYNPNIAPVEEYSHRVAEIRRLIGEMEFVHPVTLMEGRYDPKEFYEMAKGLEDVPEGGERCFRCYRLRMEEAAKLANADSFIGRLPKGYETMVTSDGSNLSQGQRQLLAIARAAVADPPVLILDEATSSIDTRTERLIEKGMDRLMEGRTVFVIAHRLSTVRNSNAIMVLDQGEIIERGDHEDLLAQKGVYYRLYNGMFELA